MSGPTRRPRFASVVLDVDSTLCGIEGIDWLAERRGAAVGARIAELTARAMDGSITLDRVYGERLALVQPAAGDLRLLAGAYREALAPGAASAVARLREAGVRLVLVSGGLRGAILPLAEALGIAGRDVHAVELRLDADGAFVGHDAASPLTTQRGKATVVRALGLPAPVLAVGDGATDLAMREAVDAFAAFTGFARREPVVLGADHVLESFDQLTGLVLP